VCGHDLSVRVWQPPLEGGVGGCGPDLTGCDHVDVKRGWVQAACEWQIATPEVRAARRHASKQGGERQVQMERRLTFVVKSSWEPPSIARSKTSVRDLPISSEKAGGAYVVVVAVVVV
jgi:hypothetical protein